MKTLSFHWIINFLKRNFFCIINRDVGGYVKQFDFSGANYRDQPFSNAAQKWLCTDVPADDRIAEKIAAYRVISRSGVFENPPHSFYDTRWLRSIDRSNGRSVARSPNQKPLFLPGRFSPSLFLFHPKTTTTIKIYIKSTRRCGSRRNASLIK